MARFWRTFARVLAFGLVPPACVAVGPARPVRPGLAVERRGGHDAAGVGSPAPLPRRAREPSGRAAAQSYVLRQLPRGSAPPLATTMAGRALDAVLFSARDAYLLPGVVLVVLRDGLAPQQFFTGQKSLSPTDLAAPVDGRTAFAVKDATAATAGLAELDVPESARARGHVVDLQRGVVWPADEVARPDRAAVRWVDGQGAQACLVQALARCSKADTCAELGPPWRVARSGTARTCVVASTSRGFSVHLEVDCVRRAALAVLVNAEGEQGFATLVEQVRKTARDYLP